jgi:hypothetical protein
MVFAYSDQQGMHLVKVTSRSLFLLDIECSGAVRFASSAASQCLFHERPDIFVGRVRLGNVVSQEDAARVGVDHEDRKISCIEQNGIGGLTPDSAQRQ